MTFESLAIGKIVLASAGLLAGGLGAYNFATTGCPLGTCSKGDVAVATPAEELDFVMASDSVHGVEGESCPLCPDGECCPDGDCCDAKEGETVEVAGDQVAGSEIVISERE